MSQRFATSRALKAGLLVMTIAVIVCGGGSGDTTTTTPATTTTTAPTTTTTVLPTTTTSDVEPCSTSGLRIDIVDQPELPAPVAETRRQIIDKALACDIDGLAELALQGRSEFTYSFGGGGEPAGDWRQAEGRGEPVLSFLVRVLNMSWATKESQFEADVFTTIYVWPAAFGDNPSDEDWKEVEALYSPEDIAQMKEFFGGYVGYRAGITGDGDWVFFVAGD